jgi:serine phosphatase RsbU (regulator of sigma subunit)
VIVPLAARGRTLGSITMVRTGDKPPYDEGDLAFAEDLGRRAGIAIDNAQLYAQTQDVALQLQRAVLPDALDDIAGWEIATYYAPGGRGGVGGDFYDAIALPDGTLAFVIGDVMGHGVPAAAAMAQLRSAVRAYLCIDPEPAEVVRKLDVMFAELSITQLATLVCGVVDVASGVMRFVNAGHYPPLVVRPGEAPAYAHTVPRLPLGAGGDKRVSTSFAFGAGDTLLLFTDGLVEHRGEVVDAGLQRLAAVAPTLSDGALQEQLDALVGALSDDARGDDDTTAFALRQNLSR